MRRFALLLIFVAPAAQADAEAWKGAYGGLGIGGANARSKWTTDATLGTLDESVEHSARGGLLGAQVGYRKRASEHLTLGAEFSWYGTHMEQRTDANIAGAPNRERVTKITSPALISAQLGFAGAKSLTYLRAGWAYAQIELQAINHQVGNVATWESGATGWSGGAGFEYQVRRHLSLGFEYDYLRLRMPDMTTVNSGGVTVHAADFETRLNLFLLRANYRY